MLVLREWAQFSSPYCMSTSEFEVITVGVPVCYKELGSPVVSPPPKKNFLDILSRFQGWQNKVCD